MRAPPLGAEEYDPPGAKPDRESGDGLVHPPVLLEQVAEHHARADERDEEGDRIDGGPVGRRPCSGRREQPFQIEGHWERPFPCPGGASVSDTVSEMGALEL